MGFGKTMKHLDDLEVAQKKRDEERKKSKKTVVVLPIMIKKQKEKELELNDLLRAIVNFCNTYDLHGSFNNEFEGLLISFDIKVKPKFCKKCGREL